MQNMLLGTLNQGKLKRYDLYWPIFQSGLSPRLSWDSA